MKVTKKWVIQIGKVEGEVGTDEEAGLGTEVEGEETVRGLHPTAWALRLGRIVNIHSPEERNESHHMFPIMITEALPEQPPTTQE